MNLTGYFIVHLYVVLVVLAIQLDDARKEIATLRCETRAAYSDPACPARDVEQ